MPQLPDISEIYTAERALNEEVNWLLTRTHEKDAAFLLPRIQEAGIKSVIECGCGSGILASLLPAEIVYQGIDKNAWFLERARIRNGAKNEKRHFTCFDVRNYEVKYPFDLVIAFAFLKHFGLDEWDTIVAKVLSMGNYGALGLQIGDQDFDDGTEYHHVTTTREHARAAIEVAGHEWVDEAIVEEFSFPAGGVGQLLLVWTKSQLIEGDEIKPDSELFKNPDLEREDGECFGPCALEVAGTNRSDLYRYALRWPDGVPTLYQDGRRLTCPWRLLVDVEVPADPQGGNGNTADG